MRIPRQKRLVVSLFVIVVAAVSVVGYAMWRNADKAQRGPKPTSTSSSGFLLNEVYYGCSQPVQGKWVEASVGHTGEPGYYFQPSNQEAFRRYCREEWVIEYRAVLDILRKEDVATLIGKYSPAEAWVKALGHTYIHDKAYLNRILPIYSTIKIDCIIVVHSPEGTRFFIENGEKHETHDDHQYLEVPAAEFLASLYNAPDADVTAFWLGLH